ncbi:hypothetical protein CGH99_18265 [Vibrio parahaemolyticus]|nr:hypothetical protein EN02_013860 [Vibrio parahaemolyticus]TOL39120.1 hypothetical protein CGH99_18265 [Vibrio parahaemolyticus]TOL57798.1 hypothetical protein CGH96_05590 [Vibrio parahaemolyticus]TOL76220.1 hypothetical protein CGH92_00110 [Vibrio parahaemolyticus]TON40217.1 hypothetical protein CGH62_04960 [Vibrio parahaemolyticus]
MPVSTILPHLNPWSRVMTAKPDRMTAMRNIIDQVKAELPIYEPETFVCGPEGQCIGCPKKLLEMVDSELSYWESAMERGIVPQFDEIRRFGKMCTNVRRSLVRNNVPLLNS